MGHKRYLVFAYLGHDSGGGFNDLIGNYDSLHDVYDSIKEAIRKGYGEYFDVYDRVKGELLDYAETVKSLTKSHEQERRAKILQEARMTTMHVGDIDMGNIVLRIAGVKYKNPVDVTFNGMKLGSINVDLRNGDTLVGDFSSISSEIPLPKMIPEVLSGFVLATAVEGDRAIATEWVLNQIMISSNIFIGKPPQVIFHEFKAPLDKSEN